MKVLLTGASGFLGKTVYKHLIEKKYDVKTLGRRMSDFNVDLAIETPKLTTVDLVIHCAGKAHLVPKTEHQKKLFFDINTLGTINLLKGLEDLPNLPRAFVFVSTVAVYGCEKGILIKESYPLSATDAYGQSKIQAEIAVKNWCQKHNVTCSILRLPLLIGINPPGNLGAMIKGISKGYYFNIDGGLARKSMVMVGDIAEIIPVVSTIGGTFNLTDGYHPSFSELSAYIAKQIGRRKIINLPYSIARFIAFIGNVFGKKAPLNTAKLNKIMADLTFDDTKAKKEIGWDPSCVLSNRIIE